MRERGIEVVGVDKDEMAIAQARTRLDKAIAGDTESVTIPYPKGYFDCIIYADVLDCLFDPLAALKSHRHYLRDGGYVVASMSNIRYYKAIIRLLFGGTWDYVEPGGILWRHHIRFFTLITMKELFAEGGFEIVEVRPYASVRPFVRSRKVHHF